MSSRSPRRCPLLSHNWPIRRYPSHSRAPLGIERLISKTDTSPAQESHSLRWRHHATLARNRGLDIIIDLISYCTDDRRKPLLEILNAMALLREVRRAFISSRTLPVLVEEISHGRMIPLFPTSKRQKLRKYKAGFIWEDLNDDDLITPTSDEEYVLKGCLLPSSSKAMEDSISFNEAGNIPNKKQVEEEEETFQFEYNISPQAQSPEATATSTNCEGIKRRTEVFKIDSWREEMKRVDAQRCKEISMKKKVKDNINRGNSKESSDNRGRKWALDVLRNLLNCKTVETKDSLRRRNLEKKESYGSIKSGERVASSCSQYKPAPEPNCS